MYNKQIKIVNYPKFDMRQTWRKDETLRTPMQRVMKTEYSWVKRKITSDGRCPYTEKSKNSKEIEKIAFNKHDKYVVIFKYHVLLILS